jgi:hypothetical protein
MTAAATPSPARPPLDGPDDRSDPDSQRDADLDDSPIRVATEGTTVVIAVERCLDSPTGEALLNAVSGAMATGPTRLDIDLRALENFTPEGADALVSCRKLSSELVEGLHYRTGRGPGRDALLAAYSELGPDDLAE